MSVKGYSSIGVPALPVGWTECELCQEIKPCKQYGDYAYCPECRDDPDSFDYLVEEIVFLRSQLARLRRTAKRALP